MTVYELQHRFNLEVEKHGVKDPVMSTIVEDYLNYAYQQYVTEKYDSLINPVEKFETTERISRILAPLLADNTSVAFTSITTNSPYGYYSALPADLQYIVKEKAVISTTDCDGDTITPTVEVVPIKHHMIASNLNNPFLKPDDTQIWRVNIFTNRVELILAADQTLVSYTCRYLKKLTAINFTTGVTIAIDDSVHEEIAVMAAYLYLSDLRKKENSEKNG